MQIRNDDWPPRVRAAIMGSSSPIVRLESNRNSSPLLQRAFFGAVAADVLLVADSAAAYRTFASKNGLMHEAVNVSAGIRARGAIHLQHGNGYHSRFHGWLARFNGVASKYLPNYLGWRHGLLTYACPDDEISTILHVGRHLEPLHNMPARGTKGSTACYNFEEQMDKKRVFKTKPFARWAKKVLSDALLCQAAREIERGEYEADLGQGVCKKRIALPGQGKSGSTRSLVAKQHKSAIFSLLVAKRANQERISPPARRRQQNLSGTFCRRQLLRNLKQ